jgi:hypothetical protein
MIGTSLWLQAKELNLIESPKRRDNGKDRDRGRNVGKDGDRKRDSSTNRDRGRVQARDTKNGANGTRQGSDGEGSSHLQVEESGDSSLLSIVREDIAFLLGRAGSIKQKIMRVSGGAIELLEQQLKVVWLHLVQQAASRLCFFACYFRCG